jgi:hypothetical protein
MFLNVSAMEIVNMNEKKVVNPMILGCYRPTI